MDELMEYYTSLIEHVKASSDVEGRLIEFEFLNYILDLLSDAGEFDDYTIVEDGRDSAGRWLVDGYSYDTSNFSLALFVTVLTSDETPLTFAKRDIEPSLNRLIKFIDIALNEPLLSASFEPTSSCYQVAQFIKDKWGEVSNIRLILVSNRPAADRMKEIKISDIEGRPCTVSRWDLKRIYNLESSRNEREEMVIDLKDAPLPCLVAHEAEGEKSILAVMSGNQLVSLYGQWGARLLEQNVRSFLQHRGKVNKGIRSTILRDSTHFFAYNNGLTTTAQDVTIEYTERGPMIVGLKNLQVVNGGQTTASIYSAYVKDKADLSNISVQMKLTVLSEEASSELVPKISRFANSQNKVSDADLFSNHSYHVRLEEFSRRIWTPVRAGQNAQTHWFYERARGQYLDAQAYLTPAKKRHFQLLNPRAQLLTKTDVAKIMNSWDCLPHEVSKGAQKNFAKFAEQVDAQWEKDDLFYNEAYFRQLITRAWIFRTFEKVVMKEPWYCGYRANIVTYAIARLSEEVCACSLEWNNDVLWRAQIIPEAILKELLSLGEKINGILLADDRPVGNPSEYAKRAMFWDKVKRLSCDIKDIGNLLISKEEAKEQFDESKAVQKTDDGIHAQERVLKTDKRVWSEIVSCLHDDDAATHNLIGILKIANHPTKLPSEKQSVVLAKLLDKYADRLTL
ncbi:AIPR family protein [Aliamphritea ceti]|uniref:AIPR family protein n=1 Tax=Aliamphritea ceti TaxID=1524258 RepID=UPI0021C375E0|nr:AIPR family protein [Aliamphritea ceti]